MLTITLTLNLTLTLTLTRNSTHRNKSMLTLSLLEKNIPTCLSSTKRSSTWTDGKYCSLCVKIQPFTQHWRTSKWTCISKNIYDFINNEIGLISSAINIGYLFEIFMSQYLMTNFITFINRIIHKIHISSRLLRYVIAHQQL